MNILVIGGYGGVGRPLSRLLLSQTIHNVTISGRNGRRAKEYAELLAKDFPGRISSTWVDARDENNLNSAMKDMDLAIITATVPDEMDKIARAAIKNHCDLLDILVRGDVVDRLEPFKEEVRKEGIVVITQAGFHPGMIAPFIRLASKEFDTFEKARVSMSMDAVFETPTSLHEILYEMHDYSAQVFDDGKWRKASYKDLISTQFSTNFGVRKCYPLEMREIYPLQTQFNLKELGVYVAGFGIYIDYFVFPLVFLLSYISRSLSQKVGGQLIYQYTRRSKRKVPRVELKLETEGVCDKKARNLDWYLYHPDGYILTAIAVIACLKQYVDKSIASPGIHLMGTVVDEQRLFTDLKKMGLSMWTGDKL